MVVFRVVRPADASDLAKVFADVDARYFRPHPFTRREAQRIASLAGEDVYALLFDDDEPVAYGMLRGWDEGSLTPSLGIAVRSTMHRRGFGRLMMEELHAEARRRGAIRVRLRVHRDNMRARHLYESMDYRYAGEDLGELVMLLDLHRVPRAGRAHSVRLGTLTAMLLDVDAAEYIAFLAAVPHDIYHLPAYVRLCAEQEEGVPRVLYAEDGGRRFALPLVLRSIPGTDRHDATSPYGYPGPLSSSVADGDFARRALEAGLAALRTDGAVSLFVRFHPLQSPEPPKGVGEVALQGETVSVDLSLPRGVIWAQTRHNHRRDIVRAVEDGLTARVDWKFERIDDLKELYRATMDRRGAAPHYYFGDAYWDGLRRALGDRLHLLVVEGRSRVAAAGLFVESDGIVQYHLAGSDDSFPHAEASKLLIHFARTWAAERGNHHLHLGGGVGGAADSLLHFKAGFSPLRHAFYTLRAVLDEAEYDRLVHARDPSLNADDLRGFFPAYRVE